MSFCQWFFLELVRQKAIGEFFLVWHLPSIIGRTRATPSSYRNMILVFGFITMDIPKLHFLRLPVYPSITHRSLREGRSMPCSPRLSCLSFHAHQIPCLACLSCQEHQIPRLACLSCLSVWDILGMISSLIFLSPLESQQSYKTRLTTFSLWRTSINNILSDT